MRRGHGREQPHGTEHRTGTDGHPFAVHVADGRVVPSPLDRPARRNCDGHVVARIRRPGRVASARNAEPTSAPLP